MLLFVARIVHESTAVFHCGQPRHSREWEQKPMNTRYIRCAKCGRADLPTKTQPGTSTTMRCPDCCEPIGTEYDRHATMCRECCPTGHQTHGAKPAVTPTPATPAEQAGEYCAKHGIIAGPETLRMMGKAFPLPNGDALTWEERVQVLEAEGLTRSDAQAVVDAEDEKAGVRPMCECGTPLGDDGKCHWHGCDKSVSEPDKKAR